MRHIDTPDVFSKRTNMHFGPTAVRCTCTETVSGHLTVMCNHIMQDVGGH